jgi:vacuolar-type H+-ATPase subunit H|tara:strand:+ start:828 stop:1004 length:177 start_codon:yes stop_codon:yes gene_type:complete
MVDMPVSKAIKQALDNIEGAKTKKTELLSEAVTNLANLNMVEHLMQVHTGKKTKDAVF